MPAARRIFPAPRSSRPLPPPSLRPSPLPSRLRGRVRAGGSRGWAGGAGGGAGGGPPPGRRPAAAGRISTAAVRRDRLRDGWEGRRGRWLGGAPSPRRRAHPPRVLQPPGSRARRIPGPREPDPSPRSPPSRRPPPRGALPRGGVPRGGAPVSARGGRAAPPTARPLSHPGSASNRVGRGGADCPQCAPGGSRRRARGVPGWGAGAGSCLSPAPPRPGATPSGEASARGQRRCRPPTRPVLKHGPRSLTRARVRGSHESRRGAMKVKAALSRRPRWDPEASPVRRGRTTGPSRPPRRGGGA